MEWTEVVYEKIKNPFVRFCVWSGITANHLTLFNHFITLTVGCWGFSRGEYWGGIIGLGIMFINSILDYLDGDVAEVTNKKSKLGAWLDTGFDVIIQNAVMGAIAIGCFKMGLSLIWIVLFFISNSGNNLVSFFYNQTFGFTSVKGNELFRGYMDKKPSLVNWVFKNGIDPTSTFPGLFLFTFRYWIVFGILFDVMSPCFIVITIIGNLKWFMMFILYALHEAQFKNLYVLQVLALLDEERDEFFKLRNYREL